jgi:hypothetical protein
MRFLLLFFALTATALAQQEPCGLRTMIQSAAVIYPQLAIATRVQGDVIMLVTFKTTGDVEQVKILSGPKMLEAVTTKYVMSWHANEYPGPRTCPIVVRYRILPMGVTPPAEVSRTDLQHATVFAYMGPIQY